MALLQRAGQVLLGVFLLALPLASAAAQDSSPLHGLWKVTAGPAQSAGGTCAIERATFFSQIAAWPAGGWLSLLHAYPQHTMTGTDVVAVLPAQHKAEDWPEGNRPSPAVADQINKLGLVYGFTGALSADGNELSGNDTQLCFYWAGDELTGYQKMLVPIRATRTAYAFGAIEPGGQWIDSVKQGETFHLSLDSDEVLGWPQGWVEVLNSNPTIWLKLTPDEANTRYLAGPITIAEPPNLNLDLPAEGLAGRLYAKAGVAVQFMVYPSLAVVSVTVAAP
jgi:hypothetical protein